MLDQLDPREIKDQQGPQDQEARAVRLGLQVRRDFREQAAPQG